MRLRLEARPQPSRAMTALSPVIAIALTVCVGGVVFAARGLDPLHALHVYFVEPVTTMWSIEELVVKAAPLVLIGVGLAVCFRANLWNIGAEGQLTAGAIAGGAVPVLAPDLVPWLALPLMLALGMAGGMAWAAVPALLRNRFGANEILTSLMLVYVAQYLLDWLVRGPWRDPHGYNFPKTAAFQDWQLLPTLGFGRVHLGAVFAIVAVVVLFVLMSRTLKGFEVRVSGDAPRAGGFGGFSRPRTVWFCFGLAGALAGLAGICEAAGPIGQLQPHISPGYGFTAIIVAFLGRLNPIGVLLAGLVLAISYLGGEAAQVELGISDKTATVFQGVLLFFILACDTLIRYRVRWVDSAAAPGQGEPWSRDRDKSRPEKEMMMKPRVVAILLAIFLGGIGLHRFYMNRPGSGIIYILFCWTFIPAIVALVEAILLLLMTDDEFDERYRAP